MVDHSLLSVTLKRKTRKLHPYLVSVYGVPSLGIQSPSSSLVLLMGPVPDVGGLVPLRSRPYQPESASDQPAPWTLTLPDSVSRVPSPDPYCPSLSLVPLLGPTLNSGRLPPLRSRPHQQNCVPLWFLLPGSLPQAHGILPYPWPHCWALTPTPVDFLHSETCHTSQNQCK